ncbi:hypothetical protein [Nocardia sp. CA-120079]|uniref:hypothetical protein n=1 Tax=Nocardia sp. CA-120079 TaxID=3239974 RepID=UPI003D9517DC
MLDWKSAVPRAATVIRESLLRPDLIRSIRAVSLGPLLPSIDGIEITQSIQFFRADQHLTDPSDIGPDNSARLVASKPAWVRVYANPGLFIGTRPTGLLDVETYGNDLRFHHTATLSPQFPGSVDASVRDYLARRSTRTNTLNFVIPANQFHGRMRLTCTLTDLSGNSYETKTLIVHATVRQTLRLRGILVSYQGPSSSSPSASTLNLAAPTIADLRVTAAFASRALPVRSDMDLGFAGTIPWNLPLDDPKGPTSKCTPNWDALMVALREARQNDGNRPDVIYYGLLPTGTPDGSSPGSAGTTIGCGEVGLGASVAGNQPTLLHELGHALGFSKHTSTSATPLSTEDTTFPDFEPHPDGSIGEFGLDIAVGAILPPQTTFDFMVSGSNKTRWMSLFRHKALIGHRRLGPEDLDIDIPVEWDPRWRTYTDAGSNSGRNESQYRPVIAVTGFVDGAGRVEVQSVARIAVASGPSGEHTTLIARLGGRDEKTLARARLYKSTIQSCGAADWDDYSSGHFFEAYLPDAERGAELRIEDTAGDRPILWQRTAPQQPPTIERFEVKAIGNSLEMHWRTDRTQEELTAWLQYSTDNGSTWDGLATGITDEDPVFDVASLASGRALIRILVHNGFDTVVSDPIEVEVPPRTPEIVILWPEQNGTLVAGGPLRVLASAATPSGRPLTDAAYHWVLDEQNLGDGEDEWFDAPAPGAHRLTLSVRADGFESERTVNFTCIPDPRTEPPTAQD